MIDQKMIARINELAKKSKSVGLTETEQQEQAELRKLYIQDFKKDFKSHLHSIKIVDPNGKDVTPEKLKQEKKLQNM